MDYYPEKITDAYDKDYYTDGIIYDQFAHRIENSVFREQADMIQDVLGPVKGQSVLDVGSALGCLSKNFEFDGATAYGQDGSAWACENSCISETTQCGNLSMGILYKDNTFNLVTAIETLEHVDDTIHFLNEIERVLQDGGFFYGSIGLDPGHGHVHIGTIGEWETKFEQTNKLKVHRKYTDTIRMHPIMIKWGWSPIIAQKG